MKKVMLVCLCLVLSFVTGACSSQATTTDTGKYISENALQKVEQIDDTNRYMVGKEILFDSGSVEIETDTTKPEISGAAVTSPSINALPENPIIKSLAQDDVFPGTSIQTIETDGTNTPELIGPNSATGIFSLANNDGWHCKAGDTIRWTFEKYPLDNPHNQAFAVGYIKDGVMSESTLYQNEISGTYELTVTEDGVYHIYFICASSDPIALKAGKIQIK